MKVWSLGFLPEAERDLAKLDREIRRRIIDKLDWLLENFENILPEVLTGEFREFYKLRIGDWRVIYKINWSNNTIIVCYIDKRDKVYKKR
jgi:mRNA interferase RelE/StbE